MPAEFRLFRFSIAQLIVGGVTCALVLCLNMQRKFECLTYSAGPGPSARTDELKMRQGWPFPFIEVSESIHGATGPSEAPPEWPSPSAKRKLLPKPLFINVAIWLAVLGIALTGTLVVTRYLTSRNNLELNSYPARNASIAFLNPMKWNIVCWLLLLLWLLPSLLMNAPIEPDFEHSPTYLIGWPFTYLEIAVNAANRSVRTYTPISAALNFIFVATTLVSLVYAVQNWIPQFSIRIMLIGVAIVAGLIVIGQAASSTGDYHFQAGLMMALYITPIFAALAFIVYNKSNTQKTAG